MRRKKKQGELQELLDAVIVKAEQVNGEKMLYYQGMHDVVGVFLLTVEQNLAFHCSDIASRFLLTDYLQLTFDRGLVPLF